jgi:O-antigen ligase
MEDQKKLKSGQKGLNLSTNSEKGKALENIIRVFSDWAIVLYIIGLFAFEKTETYAIWRLIYIVFMGAMALNVMLVKKKVEFGHYCAWQVGFLLFNMLSILWTISVDISFEKCTYIMRNIVIGMFIYNYISSVKDVYTIIKGMIIAGLVAIAYYSATGMLENLGETRLGGNHSNAIATFLSFAFISSVFMISEKKKAIYLIPAITTISIMLYTGSRKTILLIILVCALFLLLRYPRKRPAVIVGAVLGTVTLYLVIMNVPALYEILGERLEGMTGYFTANEGFDDSTATRLSMIERGWTHFLQKPILGYGSDSYRLINLEEAFFETYAHNNYIELLVDLGIIGTVIYYSFYVYLGINLFKIYKLENEYSTVAALLFAIIIAIPIFEMGQVTYYTKFYHVLFAVMAAVVLLNRPELKKKKAHGEQKVQEG